MRWLLLVGLVMGCVEDRRLSGPVFDVRVWHRVFPMAVRTQVDVLFVVDNTPGMAEHRETLRANARNLTWPLSFHRLDLQLGFITTGCPDGQLHAASRGGRFLIAENAGDGRTNFEGELSTALLASFDGLDETSCSSRPLEAIVRALLHPANAGFLREDAQLVIVFLTPADDKSSISVDNVAETVKATKRDSSVISVGGAFNSCPPTSQPPPRLGRFLDQFPNRSNAVPLCAEDLSSAIQLLPPHNTIGNPCLDVMLADPPDCVVSLSREHEEILVGSCSMDPSTLCWRIAFDPAQCPGGWNEMVLIDHFAPTSKPATAVIDCVVPSPAML